MDASKKTQAIANVVRAATKKPVLVLQPADLFTISVLVGDDLMKRKLLMALLETAYHTGRVDKTNDMLLAFQGTRQ